MSCAATDYVFAQLSDTRGSLADEVLSNNMLMARRLVWGLKIPRRFAQRFPRKLHSFESMMFPCYC